MKGLRETSACSLWLNVLVVPFSGRIYGGSTNHHLFWQNVAPGQGSLIPTRSHANEFAVVSRLQNSRSGWISRIPSRLRSYGICGKTSPSYVIMCFRLSTSSLVPLAPRCYFTCVPLGFFLLTFTVSMYSRVCWDSGMGNLRFSVGYGRDIGIEQRSRWWDGSQGFGVFPGQTQKYGFSPVRDLGPTHRQQGGRCPSK